jgi:uncharacterized protein with HEPN domain
MMRFACIKQMEIIGEASNHISDETKLKFSSVEWLQIVGMRNVFVHEYFGVDSNLVWEIIKNDIPDFASAINLLKMFLMLLNTYVLFQSQIDLI